MLCIISHPGRQLGTKNSQRKIKLVWNYAHRIDESVHWNISNSWIVKGRWEFFYCHILSLQNRNIYYLWTWFLDIFSLKRRPSNIIGVINAFIFENSVFKNIYPWVVHKALPSIHKAFWAINLIDLQMDGIFLKSLVGGLTDR